MNMDLPKLFLWLRSNQIYKQKFDQAYPSEEIGAPTVAKALASFERTIISRNSRFDKWIQGDESALKTEEVRGFAIFLDSNKGNCVVCHSGPNLTDNGFHNIGLPSFGHTEPDLGRYAEKPLKLMRGAFKTPTVRDASLTAPYFHDGSAETLEQVVEHYVKGGVVKTNLSPNLKSLILNEQEKADLVAFLKSLESTPEPFELPVLPPDPSIVMQPSTPGPAISAK